MSDTSRLTNNKTQVLDRRTQDSTTTFTPSADKPHNQQCDLEAREITKALTEKTQRIPGVAGGVSKIESIKSWIEDSIRNLHLLARRNPAYLNQAKKQALDKIDHQLDQLKNHSQKCGDDLNPEITKYRTWLEGKKKEIGGMRPLQSKSFKQQNKTENSVTRFSNFIPGWFSDRLKNAGDLYNSLNEAAYDTGLSRFMGAPEVTGYKPKKPQVMPGIQAKPDYTRYGILAPGNGSMLPAPIRIPVP